MKKIALIGLMSLIVNVGFSQDKYFTKTGKIFFDAGTGIEDISATNKSTTSVIDIKTGQLAFETLIKGFEFKNQLMQDHFNENYMESEKLPKSIFKGNIENINKVNFKKDGSYSATIKGKLELHGVTKDVTTKATIKVTKGEISAICSFDVNLEDYKINIPSIAKEKLSSTAKIKVECNYAALKK
jgi:hypothetical protein